MYLYLIDANQPTASSELKKTYRKSDIQIDDKNEKLDAMLIQVNVSQNSLQIIYNTFCGFQPLAIILTGKFYNIHKYKSNYYLWEDSKKEC